MLIQNAKGNMQKEDDACGRLMGEGICGGSWVHALGFCLFILPFAF
jgi:hypothetical protein